MTCRDCGADKPEEENHYGGRCLVCAKKKEKTGREG